MNIREYIQKRPLVFDGAMGTYLTEKLWRDTFPVKCELANLEHSETVLEIHQEYLNAGCMAIKTNTFGANLGNLDQDLVLLDRVLRTGYRLAVRAVEGTEAVVFADIGPIPQREEQDLFQEYCQIVDCFLEEGAVNFLFETFSNGDCLEQLAQYIRKKRPNAFIIASFAVQPDGYTREGQSGRFLFSKLRDAVDAVGFNCISGAHHLLEFVKTLPTAGRIVSVMPNAGYPTVVNNRTFFGGTPQYYAEQMAELARLGVQILGGCCGTTPDHIRETVRVLKLLPSVENPKIKSDSVTVGRPRETKKGRLQEKIEAGQRVIAVELDPPADINIAAFLKGAQTLKAAGVDTVTIADCPIARAKVDSSLLACKLKRELDIDPLPHMTCRDRNINATKALLLGLQIEDVHNILVVTGDPVPNAERDEVKSVYNFNSRKLAKFISTLNQELFPTPFYICGALNPNAKNFAVQLRLAAEKIESGVSLFLTQPVFTEQAIENIRLAKETLHTRILGGIMPLVSYRNARFMSSEVAGVVVPEELVEQYKNLSPEACTNLAVETSVNFAKRLAPFVDGYYLITPFKRVKLICRIVEEIRRLEKTER